MHVVRFDDGDAITAKAVIIATGARYRRLPLDRLAEFEGVGVYYAATQMEAQACRGGPVAIVGGGNSAGQAALFLSRSSAVVHLIIRGETLGSSMSRCRSHHWFPAWRRSNRPQIRNMLLTCVGATGIEPVTPRL